MKSLVILVCVVTAASAVSFSRLFHEEWKVFKLQYQKKYKSRLEEEFRMKVYAENKLKVTKHNQLFERGLVSFSQGLNKYSDLLLHEFESLMNGYNRTSTCPSLLRPMNTRASMSYSNRDMMKQVVPADWEPPKKMDWRKEGAVTDVKDQGTCGSCWAFSATGALEGHNFLHKHKRHLVSLSEQNLIDCTYNEYGNCGCEGGLAQYAFAYIRDNRGVDTETSYPYQGMDYKCRYNPNATGADDDGFATIREDDEIDMKLAVASMGPVSTAICSLESFRHYASGVYYEKKCTADCILTHAVLIVGYNNAKLRNYNLPYWLVKNSWGTSWGMGGYGKLARNFHNNCRIASSAIYPLVKPKEDYAARV